MGLCPEPRELPNISPVKYTCHGTRLRGDGGMQLGPISGHICGGLGLPRLLSCTEDMTSQVGSSVCVIPAL